jgi:hypothetical protein
MTCVAAGKKRLTSFGDAWEVYQANLGDYLGTGNKLPALGSLQLAWYTSLEFSKLGKSYTIEC